MDDTVFNSDRSFVVFSYAHSHGLLLLRSMKTVELPTRIDILIQNVRAMEIRSWFHGVEIVEVSPEFLLGFDSNSIEMVEPGNRVYALNGRGWQGFIVGGIVTVAEDQGEFTAPSRLLNPGSRPA